MVTFREMNDLITKSAPLLNFQDTEIAFADKSDDELKEKYWLFRLMNSEGLVNFLTSLAQIALKLHLPIEPLIKRTIFRHFCGGETIEECEKVIEKLANSNIGTILDYSVEGKYDEEDFGRTKDEIIRTIKRAKDDPRIPFAVFKVSGIAPLGTLEKVSSGIQLTEKGERKWKRIQERVEEICSLAYSIGQPVFIDAEESWIQGAIDLLAETMMKKYNRERPLIYNTIQLYRKDRLDFLKKSHHKALSDGYFLAVKLVRGAYMEKERERAEQMGYPSPIHDDKTSTDRDYDQAIMYCLENLKTISFVAGTHNEASIQLLTRKMYENRIEVNHPHIFFSQLYGMSDNLSYVLAKNGYNVTKYVPYGPVRDTIPYLIRRAQENTAVMGQMSRELELIIREMKRRGIY
ncbi:MAG: proline dehydrogenase family protein [Acidobacteriota bacterium]|nr:proline dehydrogenase family protein [Pyrinomonadaceae bacterium]MDW8304540.1 proline dehydrogenase family protein [Acidobacteriota bacterium]